MCKFHKDLARAVATNPDTGEFHAGHYAVALVGMFPRLEEYIPDMFGCDGFVPKHMAGQEVQDMLNTAEKLHDYVYHADGSLKSLEEVRTAEETFREDHLGFLRAAMLEIAAKHDLSEEGLNFPDFKKQTSTGYKATCCADPDPRENGPFLSVAIVHSYEGYRDEKIPMVAFGEEWDGDPEYYAERPLTIKDTAPNPDVAGINGYNLQPVMDATRDYHAIDGVREVIEEMFCHAVTRIFRSAPDDLANGIGFNESFGCAMCGSAGKAFREATDAEGQEEHPQPLAER